MNFGTSLLVIFILTCTGLVIYWFYHKYKLEREQVRFMQWARSVMRERYDSDSDSSSTNPRYRADSTWSNTSNDSSANLVEEGDHHDHSISYGAIDYNSRNNNSETEDNSLDKTPRISHNNVHNNNRNNNYGGYYQQHDQYIKMNNNDLPVSTTVGANHHHQQQQYNNNNNNVKQTQYHHPNNNLILSSKQQEALLYNDKNNSRPYHQENLKTGGLSL